MLGVYILVASVIACLIVCSLVVLRRVRDDKTVVYGLLTIALLVLSVANFMSLDVTGDQLFYVRWVMASTTVALYLIYILILTLKKHPNQKPFYASALFYLTLIVFGMDFTDLLFAEVVSGNPPKPIPEPGVALFFGHFALMMGLAIKRLTSDIFGTRSLKERRQYIPLIVGIVPIIILAPLTSFILPNLLGISQFVVLTPLYAFIFVAAVGYAIVRHGLFDVRRVVIRTIAYVLSLITLAAAYYTVAYVLSITLLYNDPNASAGVSPLNIFLALLLAFLFQPIKHFFDKATDRIFFRDQYDSEEFYVKLSGVLTSTTDLRGLLQRAAKEIGTTLKAEQAFFYVQYNHVHHISAGTKAHSLIPLEDGKALDEYVRRSGSGIIVTELLRTDNPVRKLLVSHKIAILMPLVKHGAAPSYLALGDQLGNGYTERDLKTLRAVADELIIAIQNALSLQEVKDINEHLEQRIKTATAELKRSNAHLRRLDATKDEFVSMASHQLRTPLTSIKGYLSMILEGDVGKVSPAQRKVLSEAFDSSERMVRLIHDFLNVSRLQTGKFSIEYTSYDIVKLIKQEIDTLQSTAEKRNITIAADMDVGMLDITLDETKMRQVIMNFIDNALYYSQEGTTVHVELKKVLDVLVFRVTDTGIGVPESEREHLFTKFYRASNARLHRPDGTGVGLYLAKKVITAHGGGVLYEPHPDGGSTFGFTLPLPK